MSHNLLDPKDSIERQNEKLLQIASALMRQVEQDNQRTGAAYAQFERAALLEQEVKQRTRELEHALTLLNDSNAKLSEANRAAEQARANLANAIETIQEGFALFNPDEELVMCNSRFGMHMNDLKDDLVPGLTFEGYVRLVSHSQDLDLGSGVTPESWHRRRMERHKQAHSVFNVRLRGDRWVQVSEHRTNDGGTVVMQTDITDIIRLEREERGKLLDQQARMISATLDHINQGVSIFDRDGRLLGWNRKVSRVLSVSAQRFRLGVDFRILLERLAPELTFLGAMTYESLVDWTEQDAARDPINFEVRNAAGRHLAVFAQEMPDRGFVISFTDVTEERATAAALSEANESLEKRVTERTLELEDALQEAERANASKNRFVAAASHDLLQPLSAAKLYILGLAESLAEGADRDVALKSLGALDGVEGIIDALLNISKLDSQSASADVQAFPLDLILMPLADEFAPAAAMQGLQLRIVPTSAWVHSDPAYLRRILRNLISNAIRYTARGKVLAGVRRHKGTVSIQVWDTGPGIAEADQEKVFQEFQRLNAKASASEGMGLGLAIVERACALLGHPLELKSRVGVGSGFLVTVPAAGVRNPHIRLTHTPPMARKTTEEEGPVVMLVENDEDLRLALLTALEGWGCTVLDAATAEQAVEIMDDVALRPDCYVVDYQLGPGMDGLDLARDIRSRGTAPPICVISADRSAKLRSRCTENGAAFLTKPINPAALQKFVVSAAPPKRPELTDITGEH